MRRVALAALAVLSACGQTVQGEPGPLDTFYRPSGLAVHDGKLVVASSNFDLLYRSEDGGSVIAVDPNVTPPPAAGAALLGGTNVRSFTGDLAIADPTACGLPAGGGPVAVLVARSAATLYPIRLDTATGAPICEGCGRSLEASSYTDPLGVGLACGAGAARAYVGYLRTADAGGWITEYDLTTGGMRSAAFGIGPVRSFAFDARSGRLWFTGLSTSVQTTLRWIDVGRGSSQGGCAFDGIGGTPCTWNGISLADLPSGFELHGIALANPDAPGQPAGVRRVYLTGRYYDLTAAAVSGGRTVDLGGTLLVGDLVDNGLGGVDLRIVDEQPIGAGAGDVRVLPPRVSGGAPLRDVVVAIAEDDGSVWVYDDAAGTMVQRFDRDVLGTSATGAPAAGHVPYGVAVDPAVAAGNVARFYVGSFDDNWVTPVDVPLDDPGQAAMVQSGGQIRRITGGTK